MDGPIAGSGEIVIAEDVVARIPVVVVINLNRPVSIRRGDVFDNVVGTRKQHHAGTGLASPRPREVQSRYGRIAHFVQTQGCPSYPAEVEGCRRDIEPLDAAENRTVGAATQVVCHELVVQPPIMPGVDGPTASAGESIVSESVAAGHVVVVEADANRRIPVGGCDVLNCIVGTRHHLETGT